MVGSGDADQRDLAAGRRRLVVPILRQHLRRAVEVDLVDHDFPVAGDDRLIGTQRVLAGAGRSVRALPTPLPLPLRLSLSLLPARLIRVHQTGQVLGRTRRGGVPVDPLKRVGDHEEEHDESDDRPENRHGERADRRALATTAREQGDQPEDEADRQHDPAEEHDARDAGQDRADNRRHERDDPHGVALLRRFGLRAHPRPVGQARARGLGLKLGLGLEMTGALVRLLAGA